MFSGYGKISINNKWFWDEERKVLKDRGVKEREEGRGRGKVWKGDIGMGWERGIRRGK